MKRRKKDWKTILFHKPHPLLTAAYLAAGAVFVILSISVLWVALTPIPALNSFDSRRMTQSTQIYDREGKTLLFDLNHNVKREVVPLSEIDIDLQRATIAIEDASFYEHGGISIRGIARAIAADILIVTGIRDGFTQGGSTLTQQVVKNTILTGKKSVVRKVQEWILAIRLEQRYTKDEVLEFYFNVTPYGGTMYGAEVASRAFYGKSASDLTLAESAYLASIPQRPTYFSPYGNNQEDLDIRKNYVLDRMHELGYITEEERDAAKAEEVTFSRQQNNSILAPHFVFYIEQQLEEKYGPDVATQGLTVITTLDADLQRVAQETVYEQAISNEARFNAENGALVAIDPKTGHILAMVGSRDYFDENIDGNYNVAIANRQPGSSFKPFVYAAALQKGYTTETAIFDVPTQFSTTCAPSDIFNREAPCYAPGNYDETFRGPMTFRTALAQSINIPAIKALYLAGIPNTLTLAKNMGLTTLGQPSDYGLSLALGAAEVRLLDMVSAFSAFANDGVLHEPVGILKITGENGRTIEEYKESSRQVVDPEIARQISSILSDNQARQPAYAAQNPFYFPGYDVAAKTGTTNDSKDFWVMGYTPSIAIGVWAGNNDPSKPTVRETAGYVVSPMWSGVMRYALNQYPQEFFTPPAPIPDDLPGALRGLYSDGIAYHDILYWVNKDNPRGGGNSWGDGQFPYWEFSVNGNWSSVGTGTTTATTTEEGVDEESEVEESEDRSSRRDSNEE